MKLRFPFRSQQLLSAAASALLLTSAASAQDMIITTTGQRQPGKIIGVSPSGKTLDFQLPGGNRLGLPLASIKEVQMAVPPELTQAFAAYQAKDFPKSLTLMKGVVDKFKGMPSPWAQQATAMLGELYIQTNDLAKAEEAYNDFKRLYPGGGSLQSEVGLSRLAVAKKDYATAKEKLQPITDAALAEKIVTPGNALAYSQAFLVSGQVKEAEGNFAAALEDYLRTVTLFYHDRAAVSSAQERADALREAHKDVTAP
jgi:tetratricopeptide (TPR) repeat protein